MSRKSKPKEDFEQAATTLIIVRNRKRDTLGPSGSYLVVELSIYIPGNYEQQQISKSRVAWSTGMQSLNLARRVAGGV
jgi:hypothetical protein